MNKETFEALSRILDTTAYIFEDQFEEEDQKVLADIAIVRAWVKETQPSPAK